MILVPPLSLVVILLIGVAAGVWLGQWLMVRMNILNRVTEEVGQQIMDEHRAYRAVLADRTGSEARADQLMKAYRKREML